MKLFSYISKPEIRENDLEHQTLKNNFLNGKIFENNESLKELYKDYLVLKNSNTYENEKFLNLIDDDILQCFDAMRQQNI